MSFKTVLTEAYAATAQITKIHPNRPGNTFKALVGDPRSFKVYTEALSEGLNAEDKKIFNVLAENTRVSILENSTYGMTPYDTLSVPVLRVFWPKTISKELVTVVPMDKPEVIRPFLRVAFAKYGDKTTYTAPSMTDVSSVKGGTGVPATTLVTSGTAINLLTQMGLDAKTAHIERTARIVGIAQGTNAVTTDVISTINGTNGAFITEAVLGTTTVRVTGTINFLDGTVNLMALNATTGAAITNVTFKVAYTISLEENTINPQATMNIQNIRIVAKDREISANWSIQMQQDVKALYDVNVQSELTTMLGDQIALDIDRENINTLAYTAKTLSGAQHTAVWSKTPTPNFAFGPAQWYQSSLMPVITQVANQIYADTNIGTGNVLAVHPCDAAVLQCFQDYHFTGTGSEDGEIAQRTYSVAGGAYKVLVSTVVPQGQMLVALKDAQETKMCYVFAPYVPAVISPFPMGNKPTMTLLSRYGSSLIRPEGFGLVQIVA